MEGMDGCVRYMCGGQPERKSWRDGQVNILTLVKLAGGCTARQAYRLNTGLLKGQPLQHPTECA